MVIVKITQLLFSEALIENSPEVERYCIYREQKVRISLEHLLYRDKG